jgi:hypothetical protein
MPAYAIRTGLPTGPSARLSYPMGIIRNAFDEEEPSVFGVPDREDREFSWKRVGIRAKP